jgi:hypothetical protein
LLFLSRRTDLQPCTRYTHRISCTAHNITPATHIITSATSFHLYNLRSRRIRAATTETRTRTVETRTVETKENGRDRRKQSRQRRTIVSGGNSRDKENGRDRGERSRQTTTKRKPGPAAVNERSGRAQRERFRSNTNEEQESIGRE